MILYKVVGSLERFTNYETLFKTNPTVQKAIGALYSDLIGFFGKDFRNASEHINSHSAEIDWVANAANIEEI